MDGAEDCCFEAREGKVERLGAVGIFEDGVGELIFVRVAFFGSFGDSGAARVGKTEDFGDFIKAFTDGVVAGSGNNFKIGVAGHINNLSVAARNN